MKNKRTVYVIKIFLSSLFILFSSFSVSAQVVLKALVVQDGAIVYSKPDFDGEVVTYLSQKDTVIVLTSQLFGPFYKIQTSTKQVGYISDVDIKLTGQLKSVKEEKSKNKSNTITSKDSMKKSPQRPIEVAQQFGVSFYNVSYVENTMSLKRRTNLNAFGIKIAGGDLLIRGGIPMEINVLFSSTSPSYYKDITGSDASVATTMLLDTQFIDKFAGDRSSMAFLGFGPVIKYSRYVVRGKFTNKFINYDMTNLNVGAVMSLGITKRFGKLAVRADAKYFIERTQYGALGLALMLEH
jgi:hypothetical protein